MTVVASGLQIIAAVRWEQSQTNGGGLFASTAQGPDTLSYSAVPSATTYSEILLATYSIAASGTQTVNLNSFTNLFNATVTATVTVGVLIRATNVAAGGQLRIAPGAATAINFWFGGTLPTITLSCGDAGGSGCCFLIADGVSRTVSNTVKNVDLSNPGTATIVVTLAALVGP